VRTQNASLRAVPAAQAVNDAVCGSQLKAETKPAAQSSAPQMAAPRSVGQLATHTRSRTSHVGVLDAEPPVDEADVAEPAPDAVPELPEPPPPLGSPLESDPPQAPTRSATATSPAQGSG
jgi:hypothetical protein